METTPSRRLEGHLYTEAEYPGWALLASVAGMAGMTLGAVFFVLFAHPQAELAAGAALPVVDMAFVVVATATGWPGPQSKYGFLVLAMGWLSCTVASGALLAMFVFDNLPLGWLKAVLLLTVLLLPCMLVLAAVALTERVRRAWMRRGVASQG